MQKCFFSRIYLLFVLCFVSITNLFGQQKFSPSSYIEQHKKVAQQLMRETGVPASVILAVAIHESAYGNSKIAKHLNNHFGIKGKNQSTVIKSSYKGYASVMDSYNDFIGLLQRRKATKGMFDKYTAVDYKSWVLGIARSGYSVTKDWSNRVLRTIDRYDLDALDVN